MNSATPLPDDIRILAEVYFVLANGEWRRETIGGFDGFPSVENIVAAAGEFEASLTDRFDGAKWRRATPAEVDLIRVMEQANGTIFTSNDLREVKELQKVRDTAKDEFDRLLKAA